MPQIGLEMSKHHGNWRNEMKVSKLRFHQKSKEYYEIVDEARPLSGFFPTHADFFTEVHF